LNALESVTECSATFVIEILFRQNATWQGRITWIDGREAVYFRSMMEMLGLMESALAACRE
jgi:hypothetical protein